MMHPRKNLVFRTAAYAVQNPVNAAGDIIATLVALNSPANIALQRGGIILLLFHAFQSLVRKDQKTAMFYGFVAAMLLTTIVPAWDVIFKGCLIILAANYAGLLDKFKKHGGKKDRNFNDVPDGDDEVPFF